MDKKFTIKFEVGTESLIIASLLFIIPIINIIAAMFMLFIIGQDVQNGAYYIKKNKLLKILSEND